MAVLEILEFPDSRLRTKAKPVVEVGKQTRSLIDDMFETMYDAPGIGLAATQVNVHKRLLVMDISEDRSDPLVFINPEITATSADLSLYEEGCLSIPGQYADVERPAELQLQAWNTRGRPFSIEVTGLLATVIQHELDHLNGVLFIDHLSERKKNKILGKFDVELENYPGVE